MGTGQISRIISGGLAAVFLALFLGALGVFGLTSMTVGHVFLFLAFVVGALAIAEAKRFRYKVEATVLLAACLLIADRWIVSVKASSTPEAPRGVTLDFAASEHSHDEPFPFDVFVTNRGLVNTWYTVAQNCGVIGTSEEPKTFPCETAKYLHSEILVPNETKQIAIEPIDGDWKSHLEKIAAGGERAYGYLRLGFNDQNGADWKQQKCWVFFRWDHEVEFQQCRGHDGPPVRGQ